MALEFVTRVALVCKNNHTIGLESRRLCSFALSRLYSTNSNTLESSSEATNHQSAPDPDALSENDKVTKDFVNRNPRNLEKMAVAIKDKGWGMSNFHQKYWHMLHFEADTRQTECYLEHRNGFKIIRTSTREWGIHKFLYSSSDVSAAHNIGRVMAHRCLQAGIDHVCWKTKQAMMINETVEAFVQGMTDGGVVLEEPETYRNFTKPDEFFPEYLGQELKEDLQRVRNAWEETRDKEFDRYEPEKIDQQAR